MNKTIVLILLILFGYTTHVAAMDDGAAAGEMVVVQIASDDVLDKDVQTEGASWMVPFEFVGDQQDHERGSRSVATQIGQAATMVHGLDEESFDAGVRRVMLEDQMEKARAMKKRMKYVAPCYCVMCGLTIYLTYFLPR